MFYPSVARMAINVARASSTSWNDALFVNMVIVDSICIIAVP